MKREDQKKLFLWIASDVHKEIKKRCAEKEITMQKWIEEALLEKIKQEIELGWK